MSYQPTQKELDALEIAGFSSISELLKRYNELVRQVRQPINAKEWFERRDARSYIGIDSCQILPQVLEK